MFGRHCFSLFCCYHHTCCCCCFGFGFGYGCWTQIYWDTFNRVTQSDSAWKLLSMFGWHCFHLLSFCSFYHHTCCCFIWFWLWLSNTDHLRTLSTKSLCWEDCSLNTFYFQYVWSAQQLLMLFLFLLLLLCGQDYQQSQWTLIINWMLMLLLLLMLLFYGYYSRLST